MKLDFRYTGLPTTSIFGKRFVHLFPDHAQLHFAEPVAEAAVDAEAERQVMACVRAIDQELVRRSRSLLGSRLPEMYHITTRSPA